MTTVNMCHGGQCGWQRDSLFLSLFFCFFYNTGMARFSRKRRRQAVSLSRDTVVWNCNWLLLRSLSFLSMTAIDYRASRQLYTADCHQTWRQPSYCKGKWKVQKLLQGTVIWHIAWMCHSCGWWIDRIKASCPVKSLMNSTRPCKCHFQAPFVSLAQEGKMHMIQWWRA